MYNWGSKREQQRTKGRKGNLALVEGMAYKLGRIKGFTEPCFRLSAKMNSSEESQLSTLVILQIKIWLQLKMSLSP